MLSAVLPAGRQMLAMRGSIIPAKTHELPDGNIGTVGVKRVRHTEMLVSMFSASGIHVDMECDVHIRKNLCVNVVLSNGTNVNMFQEVLERMTKVLTAMKIKVVAPPDGNIFTVGAKRFRCADRGRGTGVRVGGNEGRVILCLSHHVTATNVCLRAAMYVRLRILAHAAKLTARSDVS